METNAAPAPIRWDSPDFAPGNAATWVDGPFTLTATLALDASASPDDYPDAYDAAQLAAWHRDEWCYVAVLVCAAVADIPRPGYAPQVIALGHAAIWGVESNSDEAHFAELARSLATEAIDSARHGAAAIAERLAA